MIKAFCTAAAAFAVLASAPAFAKEKQAPACGAVSFRPLANAANDGEMTAGHYRSRFATIDVLAKIQGGQATYHLRVDNQPVKPLAGDVPKSSFKCLESKNVKTPPQPIGGACNGSRFRVVIDSSTKQKLYMLYALQGDDWKLCEAGTKA